MKNLVREERGAALLLVLALLAMGALLLTPMLQFTFTAQKSGQIQTRFLMDQYARDGGSEYAVWELLHGTATSDLSSEGQEISYPLDLNGISTTVRVRLQASLGDATIGGAEDNRIRLTTNVECEITPLSVDFDDDCLNLPAGQTGMRARYTVFLDQVSPDASVPVVAIYDELPAQFIWDPSTDPVVSLDGSFPEIETFTVGSGPWNGLSDGLSNMGSAPNQLWKWDFSSFPISFVQGQVRQFSFVVAIEKAASEYCNRTFTKMGTPPHESSGPSAIVQLGSTEGCANGGTLVGKFVNQILALPGQTTIFTYIVNIENLQGFTEQIDLVKDVLPQGGFLFCNGTTQGDPLQSCDAPMFKLVATNFDPLTDSFTDTTTFTDTMADPTQTYDGAADRWELVWNTGWILTQAGQSGDTFIMRFQAEFTPVESGSFYNEIFVDVSCAVPPQLTSDPNNISSSADYCASYSWPTGGSLVPTYDVRSETGDSNGWGNVTVGSGSGQLESWHVE